MVGLAKARSILDISQVSMIKQFQQSFVDESQVKQLKYHKW